MSFFDNDPAFVYKNLKEKVPSIKIKNKNYMNKLHSLNLSEDFWWAVSGEYAILAEYIIMLSDKDPRFLNDLKHATSIKSETSKEKVVSSVIINSIGREYFLKKDFNINTIKTKKKSIDELLVEEDKNIIANEKETINLNEKIIVEKKEMQQLPMINFTNFLTQLRLNKFKSFYLKIKKKFVQIREKSNHHDIEILRRNDSDQDFNVILHTLLPEFQEKYFPKWFVYLSEYLVKSKHKWVTTFGHGRDIYQIILNAKSYEKFGPKNIKVIPHGSTFSIIGWHIWRFSLFPDTKLNTINSALYIPKLSKQSKSDGILFCPMSLPFVSDCFSLNHFWDFMEIYRKAIQLFNQGINNNKKIKIRYKSFKYLSGFTGPFTREECKIPIENERFERVYQKYKLIVSMPFGTISAKCFQNNIECLSYNYPFTLTNKNSYLQANTFPGVHTESDKFLNELEKKIKEL